MSASELGRGPWTWGAAGCPVPWEGPAAGWDRWKGGFGSGWVGLFLTEGWLSLPSECGSPGCQKFGASLSLYKGFIGCRLGSPSLTSLLPEQLQNYEPACMFLQADLTPKVGRCTAFSEHDALGLVQLRFWKRQPRPVVRT